MARSNRLKALTDSVEARVDLPPGPVVVALSGGPDSAALAWLVIRRDRGVRAVHVHHGWLHSDRMRAAASDVAAAVGIDLDVRSVEVAAGPSPEAQARQARYEALAGAVGAGETVVTGHTLDDQAETVLANVLRGSGFDGLMGMPATRGHIHRPVLRVRRDELRELAVLAGLPFRDDPANLDLSLRRNYIRHRLLGEIERAVAPGTAAALARLGMLVADDLAFLDAEADRRTGGTLDCPVLVSLPVALERRAIRRALTHAGAGESLRMRDVEAIRDIVRSGGSIVVPSGADVRRAGQRIVIGAADEQSHASMTWPWVGECVWAGNWRFVGHVTDTVPNHFSLSPWSEVFDAGALPKEVTIRVGQPADTIKLRDGSKALGDAFGEVGVDARAREHWPVVAAGNDVIWVPGVRRAYLGWVGPDTRRYLCVGAIREET